jgi:integrase
MARKGGKNRGLFERPSGVWWVRWFHEGREYTKKIGSKGLAQKVYQQKRAQIAEGRFFPNTKKKSVTFDVLLGDYKVHSAERGTAIMRTDAGYRRALREFGDRRADSITRREVEEWRGKLVKEGLSAASVAHHLTMFRAICNLGVWNEKLKASPTKGVAWPKENNERVRYLVSEEENGLVSGLDGFMRRLCVFAIHTGLRRGELLQLLWSDIDLESGSLHVREAKSGEGRRLPLNEVAKGVLAEFKEHSGHVFGPPSNAARMRVNRAFRKAAKVACIDNVHFHDLRHTFASRLVMKGADLYSVQILMGHKTARMTQRYAHLSPNYLRKTVGLLVPVLVPVE